MDVQTGAGGQAKVDLTAIVGDLIPAEDDTSELGSEDKNWAAIWVAIALVTSITIGGVVKISTTGTTLLINESTQIEGNLTIDNDLTATNINATGLYYGNGSQLTDVSYTELDPKWTGNVSNVAFTNVNEVFGAGVNVTGNLSLITANYCIIFQSGGKICSGV